MGRSQIKISVCFKLFIHFLIDGILLSFIQFERTITRNSLVHLEYVNQKKYDNAKNIVFEGSLALSKVGQVTSAGDLANLYIDALIQSKTEKTEAVFEKIGEIFEKMNIDCLERAVFLTKALNWSKSNNDEHATGHPQLHKCIAEICWKQNDLPLCRYHYLHSSDGCGYAMMLIELHLTRGYSTEIDLFIAQVVLQYLCLKDKNSANDAFECYTSQHPNIIGPPFILPLLNFICFLLKTIDSGKLAAFTVLCEQYEVCLKRDPLYLSYLEKIATIFFNVQPNQSDNNQSFVGNLIRSLVNTFADLGPESDNGRQVNLD